MKIKNYIERSKLYPNDKKVRRLRCSNLRRQIYVQMYRSLVHFLVLSINLPTKPTIVLIVTANVSTTHSFAKHVANNTPVKRMTNLGKRTLEKRLVIRLNLIKLKLLTLTRENIIG